MRVLIAEDELLERKAMCKFIERNFSDLQIAGEAANGREAIELARQILPDIIFMDIKMPGINGLEAVKTIMTENGNVKFILVSAYDSFAYAKQAMQFGIKEYILKPGKKPEMVRAIRRIQQEIKTERKQTEEELLSVQMVKERLLTKLMQYPVDETAKQLHQHYFPKLNYGYFLVVKAPSAITDQEVCRSFANFLPATFIVASQEDLNVACVFTKGRADKKDILLIAQNLSLKWGSDIVIGISDSKSINDLPKAYQEAFTARYELGNNRGRSYGFMEQQSAAHDAVIAPLMEFIKRGKATEAVEWFKNHIQDVKDEEMDELYMRVKTMMTERNLAMPGHRLMDLIAEKDREDWISVCSLRLSEYRQSQHYMEKAKQFLKQHYARTISLEETAAYVHLSPNYFSKMFKQKYGISFIDYLTQIRLQKAKELMEEYDYSLKEISSFVGYHDPNYFSRVFKKYFKESPTHFQQTIVKK